MDAPEYGNPISPASSGSSPSHGVSQLLTRSSSLSCQPARLVTLAGERCGTPNRGGTPIATNPLHHSPSCTLLKPAYPARLCRARGNGCWTLGHRIGDQIQLLI